MLIAISNNKKVFALDAKKGKDYYCPHCQQKLILRQGDIKIYHFAHQFDSNCESESESINHILVKKYLKENCGLDIEEKIGDKVVDAVDHNNKIIYEIQCSNIEYEEMMSRRKNAKQNGYKLYWLIDCKFKNCKFDYIKVNSLIKNSNYTMFFKINEELIINLVDIDYLNPKFGNFDGYEYECMTLFKYNSLSNETINDNIDLLYCINFDFKNYYKLDSAWNRVFDKYGLFSKYKGNFEFQQKGSEEKKLTDKKPKQDKLI